jgi:hypothetical protein
MALVTITLSGCPATPAANVGAPDGNEEEASVGTLTLRDVTEGSFLPTSSDIIIDVVDATFDARPERTTVLINGTPLPVDDVATASATIHISSALHDGRNDIAVYSQDAAGGLLSGAWTVWVGSHTLDVLVLDAHGTPIPGAAVKAILGDDVGISQTAMTSASGVAVFTNVPDRTLLLEAQSPSGELGAAADAGDAQFVTVTLKAFNEAGATVPNDAAAANDRTKSAANPNLLVTTTGEGPITISRTFVTPPGTDRVGLRYAFISAEVVGGYHGSAYNDGYSVSIRTTSGGPVIVESRSVNSVPAGAYDANGRTAYRELSAPLNPAGDTVQVDLTVTNVGDGLFDSTLLADLILEQRLAIDALSLLDIDDQRLQHVSASAHAYFGGATRIHGTIRIVGREGDGVASVELHALHEGEAIATAQLAPEAESKLIAPFGASGILEVATPQLLFELPASEAALIEASGAEVVTLQVEATSTRGETASKDYTVPVGVLLRYTTANRYGPRDEVEGGDDWTQRSVREFLSHYENDITIGDISNMNGGPFPPHVSHRNGLDVDGWYPGYNARDANAAAIMLDLLNRPSGHRVSTVFVTYDQAPGDSFWEAIEAVTLDDGRLATEVIRPLSGHTGHFHWVVTDQP